jgi:hypothetical protein
MEGTAQFEGEILRMLHQLNAKKEKIQAEYSKQIADVDRQIEAVQTTARLLRESGESVQSIASGIAVPTSLRGKSVREACVEIAKLNGGIIKIGDVTPILKSTGVIKNKKHAWGATYTACARSKDFEKDETAPGTFRLVSNKQPENVQQMFPVVRPM